MSPPSPSPPLRGRPHHPVVARKFLGPLSFVFGEDDILIVPRHIACLPQENTSTSVRVAGFGNTLLSWCGAGSFYILCRAFVGSQKNAQVPSFLARVFLVPRYSAGAFRHFPQGCRFPQFWPPQKIGKNNAGGNAGENQRRDSHDDLNEKVAHSGTRGSFLGVCIFFKGEFFFRHPCT